MSEIFKALIVDDEELARQDLRDILKEFAQIEVVAEADSVSRAREQIRRYNPQIIFLDIQLPGESGFDLLEYIHIPVKIIFVTAFDQYAIRAFEVNARDYLLKPVSRERLATTLENMGADSEQQNLKSRPLEYDDSIFLKKDQGYCFQKIKHIICIEARDDYTLITSTSGEQMLVHISMKEWEKRLPENTFCRVHRSTIINIEKVQAIDPWYNHAYLIRMHGLENPLVMSRRYFTAIKSRLG